MGRKRSPARHDYDLVVRGACVYDGSDAPGVVVDVGVRDGCIVDECAPGRWSPERAGEREDALIAWLRRLGF